MGPQMRPAGAPSSLKPQGQPQDRKVRGWGAACRFAGRPQVRAVPAGGACPRPGRSWGARPGPPTARRTQDLPGQLHPAVPIGPPKTQPSPAPLHTGGRVQRVCSTLYWIHKFRPCRRTEGTQTGGRPDARWEAVGMAGPRPACLCLSFPSRNAEFIRFPPGSEILMWSSKWSEKTLVGQGTGTGGGGGPYIPILVCSTCTDPEHPGGDWCPWPPSLPPGHPTLERRPSEVQAGRPTVTVVLEPSEQAQDGRQGLGWG